MMSISSGQQPLGTHLQLSKPCLSFIAVRGNPQGITVRHRRQDLIGFGLCASQKANTTKNVVE